MTYCNTIAIVKMSSIVTLTCFPFQDVLFYCILCFPPSWLNHFVILSSCTEVAKETHSKTNGLFVDTMYMAWESWGNKNRHKKLPILIPLKLKHEICGGLTKLEIILRTEDLRSSTRVYSSLCSWLISWCTYWAVYWMQAGYLSAIRWADILFGLS